MFVKQGVSHIESFLSKILIHIEENLIKNEKLIKLSNDEKSIKPEYDSDDDSGELFQDTLEDSTLSLSGAGIRVTNKIIQWITY